MQLRRMRPVAVLTLAFTAVPFVAATTVAAQSSSGAGIASAASPPAVVEHHTWLSGTLTTVRLALDTIVAVAGETSIAASPIDAPPPPRVTGPPPPPPPPAVTDPATWIWPADGPITSPFGRRWGRMHEGVDIDARYGSAVVAAHRGTVIAAGWGQRGYGRVVHIDHGNGLVTTYSHLASVLTSVGQFVEQGTTIGTVGASGSVTAAHLHYEVRDHGVAKNPSPWLPAGGASARGNPG